MEKHVVSRPTGFLEFSPSLQAVETLSDKKKFADFAEKQGLSAYIATTYRDAANIQFPCIIKRINLNAGTGIERVDSRAHLEALLSQSVWAGHDRLFQKYLSDTMEYCSHLVCNAGRIIWDCSFAYDIDSAMPVRGSGLNRAA
jgi:glutathione synthase/RimK-type ligase-like ATP-grasp enzyme